ncbi:MAG: PilW family protein [Pyrinomonadaceae bacterium]
MFLNYKRKVKQAAGTESNENGFSLLELMIAMVIFLVVTGAIYGLLQIGQFDRNRASRRSDVLKNARVAVHVIGRDVLNAGLGYHRRGAIVPDNFNNLQLGVPADVDSARDMLTSIVVGNQRNINNLNADTNVRTDSISFAYRDVDFNGGNVIDLLGVTAPSGSPTVPRLTSKTSTGAAAAQPYDLYLIESDTSQVAVMATAVNGSNTFDAAPLDPLGINLALNGSGINGSLLRQCTSSSDTNCTTYSATAKRFFLVSYKVKPDGTLVRIIYGNNRGALSSAQIQELPMAYNVEDFQIRYVLDDGTTTDNPSVGADGLVGTADDDWQGFNKIRQLTITIKVQSTEIDERTKKPESISFSSTFSTRNLGYDAG